MSIILEKESITEIKGFFFYWQGEKIITRKRKESSPKKPTYFLFNLTKKKYISSLYPLAKPNYWQFDYDSKSYLFFLDENSSPIIQLNNNSLI